MNKTNASFFVRAGTLILGAISNFAVATLVLENFGQVGFAKYVLLTSLPSLIPFADYGLGANIFNYSADKSKGEFTVNNTSETFLISTILSVFSISIIILITNFPITKKMLFNNLPENTLIIGTAILSLTFVAVPFSLAAKKLFAERKVTVVFMIQGLIPMLILSMIILNTTFNFGSDRLLYFIPSTAYLISTIILFIISGIFRDFQKISLQKINSEFRKIMNLGIWSLCVTTIIALIWQTPKYILQMAGTVEDLTRYSLMALFLIPGLSLTAVTATWHTTNVRRDDLKLDIVRDTAHAIRFSQIVSFVFSFIAFGGFSLLKMVEFQTPDFKSQIIAFVILLITPFWMIPISALTDSSDLKWISIRIIPCFLLSSFVFAMAVPKSYELSLLLYTFCLTLSVGYFTKIRIKNFK